jgi:hypothetical protein
MFVKCDPGRPPVLPDDFGIRPAGPADECFYCHTKVGQLHCHDCHTIYCLVEFEVYTVHGRAGTWESYEPSAWTKPEMESYKNSVNWCVAETLGEVQWDDLQAKAAAERLAAMDSPVGPGILFKIKFLRVVDGGPFVVRPDR